MFSHLSDKIENTKKGGFEASFFYGEQKNNLQKENNHDMPLALNNYYETKEEW